MKMSTQLRQMLRQGMVVAPGCFDAFSARLAEIGGCKAIHMTGLGVEASLLGAPDLGLLSMVEVADHAARMQAAVSIPIMADIDTGFGGVLNVQRTIREFERAGVGGVHIEDQALPKHCPLLAGRKIVDRAEGLDRLKAALDARTDPDFVIVARTDGDVISFDELVERANLYLEAGADMVMPVLMNIEGRSMFSFPPAEQMEWLGKMIAQIAGPVMGMGSGPPKGYVMDDFERLGFSLVPLAAGPLGAAANAMAAYFESLGKTGNDLAYFEACPGEYQDAFNLMRAARLDTFVETERKYSASLK